MAAIGGLLLICYSPVLYRMATVWIEDDNMSHGLFVPIAAAYIAWTKRDLLAQIKPKVNYWGLLLVLFGFMTLCIGPPSLPTWVFLVRCSFLFSLVGCILFLGGTAILRALAFPLLLLPLMIPFPFYDQLTLPLQFIASMLAENFLTVLGYSVLREGNILHLPTQTLSVAEACSGLRSIYALTFLTLTYAYFFTPRSRARWILAAAILPVAILVNALRVTLTAIMGSYNPAWTEGTYHEMLGWSVFVFAFAILLGLNAILKKIPRLAGPLSPAR
ncbi:MAG: exosortase/archaeosortase family protein [Acidobacteriia bacterium]|nr:exosortase/archaeosortase family protein [Terriglobia bacterium]